MPRTGYAAVRKVPKDPAAGAYPPAYSEVAHMPFLQYSERRRRFVRDMAMREHARPAAHRPTSTRRPDLLARHERTAVLRRRHADLALHCAVFYEADHN